MSALFAVITTAASCGAVIAMHSSFMPLGGLIPLINMELGEIVIGGVGAGLYGMLLFVVLTMFVAGLMVGRTPEYLGKKIEAKEVKMAILAILCLPLAMLASRRSPWCCPPVSPRLAIPARTASRRCSTPTFRGREQRSGLRRLSGNTLWYNLTIGPILLGRSSASGRPLGSPGSMAAKKTVPVSAGTFPTHGGLFIGLLVGVILIVGGLTFFPALALGPIVEHLSMIAGQSFSIGG